MLITEVMLVEEHPLNYGYSGGRRPPRCISMVTPARWCRALGIRSPALALTELSHFISQVWPPRW